MTDDVNFTIADLEALTRRNALGDKLQSFLVHSHNYTTVPTDDDDSLFYVSPMDVVVRVTSPGLPYSKFIITYPPAFKQEPVMVKGFPGFEDIIKHVSTNCVNYSSGYTDQNGMMKNRFE